MMSFIGCKLMEVEKRFVIVDHYNISRKPFKAKAVFKCEVNNEVFTVYRRRDIVPKTLQLINEGKI